MSENHNNTHTSWNIWQPFLLSVAVVVGMLAGFKLQDLKPTVKIHQADVISTPQTSIEVGQVEELIRFIEAKYVDKIDKEELIEQAITGLFGQLDPHSSYISKERLQEVNDELNGSFEGIGIEFITIDDTMVVVTTLPGGPSAIAGLMAGDRIISVDDSMLNIKDMGTDAIVKKLKGPKGSMVKLGIKRYGAPAVLDYTIQRDDIPLSSIDASYLPAPDIGYIKINRFSSNTFREFVDAMEILEKSGEMKHLILDLRQNSGGYLQEATKLLSQLFVERDKLLVYTEGEKVRRNDYETTGKNFFKIDNIAVLIDEGSASASEIVAGAIQDWDRGVIIGQPSYGKGLVQEQYELKNGGALRLTVARYYTPSGRCIQLPYETGLSIHQENGTNVTPEMEPASEEGRQHVTEDTVRYYTAGGREVFGEGGIQPDVPVTIDSNLLNESFSSLISKIPEFVLLDFHSFNGLQGADNRRQFIEKIEVSNDVLDDFFAYIRRNGKENMPIRDISALLPVQQTYLKTMIKAQIGSILFDKSAFFEIRNSIDPAVETALKALHLPNPLSYSENRG